LTGVVSLLSGGIDSTTLVFWLKDKGFNVQALTIIYGQKHQKEVDAARVIAHRASVGWRLIDLSKLKPILYSALTQEAIQIPEVPEIAEHYDTLRFTVVPNRNAILLSIATAYAVSLGWYTVAYAAHWSDRGVYPDCRQEFVKAFENAMRLANDLPEFEILTPFIGNEKRDIVKIGQKLGVPYELTWSCYKGGEVHCGVCSSCRERKRAFAEADIPDPTIYATGRTSQWR